MYAVAVQDLIDELQAMVERGMEASYVRLEGML